MNRSPLRFRRGLLAIGAVTALVLTGCGSGAGGAGGADGMGEEASSPAVTADLSGVTLQVSASWSGTEQANFEKVLDLFEQETGATVNYTSFGDNASTVLGTQIEGGNPPDVALVSQPALLEQFVTNGHAQALSEDTLAAVQQNYAPDWLDLATVDGTTYGVWFKASNKSTVWYNADIYSEAGAAEPADWNDFLTQLQTVADAGYAGISIGADSGWPLTDWFENVYLRTAGGEKYDQLADHYIPWTDPSVQEALTVLGQLWGNAELVQSGAAQRTFPESVTEVFGADPRAGTVFEGDFVTSNIAEDGNSTVGGNALFYDFPSINGSEPAVVSGGNVAVALTDNPGAAELMTFLASPQAAEVWVPLGGLTSPNRSVDTALYPDDVSRQIAEAVVGAQTLRFDMSDLTPTAFGGTQGQGFWQIMIDFLQQPDDIAGTQEALEKAAAAAYGN